MILEEFLMYKIIIFFRKTARPNIFRKLIKSSLRCDFEKYLICSAFFQEPEFIRGYFSTSEEVADSLAYSSRKNTKEVDVFGAYNIYGKWWSSYSLFCHKLLSYRIKGVKFRFYRFKNPSHAKIFMVKDNNSIDLAIVGSSNLSAGAFDDRQKGWNQECDVIFWNTNNTKANLLIKELLENMDEYAESFFVTKYDEKDSLNQLSASYKLNKLEEMVRDNSISSEIIL